MGLNFGNGGNTTYLQLDYGKNRLYIYSKTEKEGYVEHVSEKGNISYRRYVNSITGKITKAYFRDSKFGGREGVIVISDEGRHYDVSAPTDGSFFANLAKDIKNVDINKEIQLSVYGSVSKKNGKEYLNVLWSYPNDLNAEGKPKWVEFGEQYPKGKQKKSGSWDFTDQEDEAFDRFSAFVNNNSLTKEQQIQEQSTQEPPQDYEDDNLPF